MKPGSQNNKRDSPQTLPYSKVDMYLHQGDCKIHVYGVIKDLTIGENSVEFSSAYGHKFVFDNVDKTDVNYAIKMSIKVGVVISIYDNFQVYGGTY